MQVFLETKRLLIKAPDLSDFDNLFALHTDADVMKYIGHGVLAQSEVMESLKKAIAHYDKHGYSFGCVFEKETGHFIGKAGLIYLAYDETQNDIEVGYSLIRKAWHKGYGTELSQALIDWGFQHLTVPRLVAVIHPNNDRSRQVLQNTNMSYVGRTLYKNIEVALYQIRRNDIDLTKITLQPASLNEMATMQNLAHLYAYDISLYLGMQPNWEMPNSGSYEGPDIKEYWEDKEAQPYLIRYGEEIMGFVIINKKGSQPNIEFNMAQFFIINKFKHKGVGRYVAHLCFKQCKGLWEVMVLPGNEGAYRFWRNTIKEYTQDTFIEYSRVVAHLDTNKKNIFQFCS